MPDQVPCTAAPRPGHADEVVYERDGALGRVLLNRPRAINSLTLAMVRSLREQLDEWAADPAVVSVSVEGVGPKGLCAGGDMRACRQSVLDGTDEAVTFWDEEYTLNQVIADYPKPFVALMDGIVMGGGVGVSAHGSLRLTTERTRLAMPETAIGFFPDVAGRRLLAQAPGQLGAYLATSGVSIDGADAVAIGMADALIVSVQVPGLLDRLIAGEQLPPYVGDIRPASTLMRQRGWVDECFAGDDGELRHDMGEILARLEAHTSEAARECAATIRTKSPLSVAVALEGIHRARAASSVAEVLEQDRVLARRFAERSDMPEGVRDVLVDKGEGAPPAWLYDRVEDVPRDVVERMFTA